MIPPRKPFPSYKWRWATLTPTEGLNEPPIFLGVLRVLRENEGSSPSATGVTAGLTRVEEEVGNRVQTRLRLVRNAERNILRNSGQYWKALGVLETTRGIELTDLGRAVADGRVTRDEFATTVVKLLELPNRSIESNEEVRRWEDYGLRIRPLELILAVLRKLNNRFGNDAAYLTPDELTSVIIPLAGDTSTTLEGYVQCIRDLRRGRLNLDDWPDCAPESNDRRMAREFLLFLANYGFCQVGESDKNGTVPFRISPNGSVEIGSLIQLVIPEESTGIDVMERVRATGNSAFVERERIAKSVLMRPRQANFRRDVLRAYGSTCFFTGERIRETLEAAHIIPVEYQGADAVGNGLCLRSDVHSLFDAGHIRIRPDGAVTFSEAVEASPNYACLPRELAFLPFTLMDAIEWRWNYQ